MNFILFTYFACIYTFFHYCLTVSCRLMCSWSVLKGHSQRMHMRISYHFLADLYITRHAHETESEEHIPNTLNKTSRIELVTSRNPDYSPYAISEHSFFYILLGIHWRICPAKAKHQQLLLNSIIRRGEKWQSLHESLSKVQGRKSLIFQTYVSFSIIFQSIYIMIICSPMLLIHFFCYFGKQRQFLPPRAYVFLTSSVHVPLDTVFNQIW